MRVIATQDGFADGTLRRRGDIFELSDDLIETDARGILVSPKWVKRVHGENGDAKARHFVEVDRLLEEKHFRDGVIAASGKGKAQNFVDVMQEKEQP